ncbi:sulfurtransferase [Alteribacillus iranensis]|uniref:Thiosulfate/3-mercaptopyruvate sulfurtransferase n=1 Tax=Alteribacillus iranensis TaxID=930128 RepID=A0A1I1ZTU4_9BACI|nr:sulfurtransferase [Alteribacillus iranensis]SFE34788.1 thiosulfate/3-mercaptopyruvate sulfurtransferase [Alteribacillus iranensis]
MGYIVSSDWLEGRIDDNNVRIVDCRFYLDNSERGYKEYKESHIPNAVYFDLEQDLSGKKEAHGGRHPLPDMETFTDKLSEAGIDNETIVIAYDDQGGMMAARFWWMLQYVGHEKVFVLDRPFTKWKNEGKPVEQEMKTPPKKTFQPHIEANQEAPLEEVKLALHDEDVAIIDARDEERFSGKKDEVDGKPGHIPGAKHYFWKNILDENGVWKKDEMLKDYFQDILDKKEIISYCGSGVTACVNVLALKEAGYDNARVYVGSWSDWVTYDDLPVEDGK